MNPKTKVYVNGKLINPRKYERNKKGKFSSKPKKWIILALALAVYVPIGLLASSSQVDYVAADQGEATSSVQVIDRTPEKVNALKAETVELISNCEVPHYHSGDAPIILDTNKKMSIGPMMFQIATVIYYEKVLYNKDVSSLEATQIALDEKQSKALAQEILFKQGGANNWYNCAKKNDIANRIALIKELEN